MKRFTLLLAALLAARSASAQEEPEPEPRPAPVRPKTRSLVSFDAGYAYQNLYSTDVNAIDVSTVLGADFSTWALAGIGDLERGWTVYGLTTTTFTLGLLLEGHFGPLRLGIGPRLGVMVVDRVTSGSPLSSPGAGVFVRASLDVITFNEGRGALFLVVRASTDTVSTALFGGTAGLGVRF